MAAMLDEDLSAQPTLDLGIGSARWPARRCWAPSRERWPKAPP